MNKFNILYHGSADDAADVLDGDDPPADVDSLRAGLTNALRRIAQLDKELEILGDLKSRLEDLKVRVDMLEDRA